MCQGLKTKLGQPAPPMRIKGMLKGPKIMLGSKAALVKYFLLDPFHKQRVWPMIDDFHLDAAPLLVLAALKLTKAQPLE